MTKRVRRVRVVFLLLFSVYLLIPERLLGVEILSKSKIEKCEKHSDLDRLDCKQKIVVNLAVPSGSSGGESSIVAELVETEDNATHQMQTIRTPPIITINKSAAYALYEITYIRDVPFKAEEHAVRTRKCEPDASAKIVKSCERQPICRPSDQGVGLRPHAETFEVVVGPANRTALSNDNFLRVHLIGDFVGYTSIPSFEDFYLVIPRQGSQDRLQNLGRNFSMWMLLERVRFTDGIECDKIGVSYEAFTAHRTYAFGDHRGVVCITSSRDFWHVRYFKPAANCHAQPFYSTQTYFSRNHFRNTGTHSFSIGIIEALNTNLLIELRADDIEYVYQRSPGKIISVTVPTFEALTQFGTATITTRNIGTLEASYSITFDCSKGISQMEEQFFIMKPQETARRSFKVYPTTNQAAKYECTAILKDSNFNEIDRATCQFVTTATVLVNGTEVFLDTGPRKDGMNGFFDAIRGIWKTIWGYFVDFFTGKSCRNKCSSFFDFSCHIQYICLGWILMFGLFLAIFPSVIILLWLLHQKGLFDPFYDWWEDRFGSGRHRSWVDEKDREEILSHQIHRQHKKKIRHSLRRSDKREIEAHLHPHKQSHKHHHHHHRHHHHNHRHHRHRNHQDSSRDSDDAWEGYSPNKEYRSSRNLINRKPKRVVRKGTPKAPRDYEEMEDQLRRRRHDRR
ncbi:hypothetical protein H6P81_014086 [Aristolochia fimbriata]|uniref:Generative cell specific-1/HAP2 domain-containing protein n=1 Tax=Aristolochia fimbriata TaxID=158543 RepID=A0AAV7EGR2_ARIFI|nr:hypothetical protein H6P81_014086 [Aristolochia fimbriata]